MMLKDIQAIRLTCYTPEPNPHIGWAEVETVVDHDPSQALAQEERRS